MSKKRIQVCITSKDQTQKYQTNAIYHEEKKQLEWIEKDALNTHSLLDFNHKILKRENKEFKMLLTFDKKKDTILSCKWKEVEKEVVFDTKISLLTLTPDYFEMTYLLEFMDNIEDTRNLRIDFLKK